MKTLKYIFINTFPPLALWTKLDETDEKYEEIKAVMDSPTGTMLRWGILGGLGYFFYKKLK